MLVFRAGLLLCLLLGSITLADAHPPDWRESLRMLGLASDRWDRHDGLPPQAGFITADAHGFVWMTAGEKLYRFDGVVFEPHLGVAGKPTLIRAVRSLEADPVGGLWIGFLKGGAVHLSADAAETDPELPGLPAGKAVRSFAFDDQGQVLAGTDAGVYRLSATSWEPIGAVAFADHQVDGVVWGEGSWWILTDQGLYRGDAALRRIERTRAFDSSNALAGLIRGLDGSAWMWRNVGRDNLCQLAPVFHCFLANGIVSPKVDREGSIWWGSVAGLRRVTAKQLAAIPAPDLVQAGDTFDLDVSTDLSASADGSMWAMDHSSLHRFKPTAFEALSTPSGGLASDGNGIWVVSFTRGMLRLDTDYGAVRTLMRGGDGTLWTERAARMSTTLQDNMAYAPVPVEKALGRPIVTNRVVEAGLTTVRLDRTSDGSFWAASLAPPRLTRIRQGAVTSVPLPSYKRGGVIRRTMMDRSGGLWLAVGRDPVGLYRFAGGQWKPVPGIGSLVGRDGPDVGPAVMDMQDRVWLGIARNTIVRVDGTTLARFDERDGLEVGVVLAMEVLHERLWIAGTEGLAAWNGDRFVKVGVIGGRPLNGIAALASQRDGTLWLSGSDGITRIPARQWQRALADPHVTAGYTRYDYSDGVEYPAFRGAPLPGIAETDDGLLWFATEGRLYRLNTSRLPVVPPPPVVAFRSVLADGREVALASPLRLPVGTSRAEITWSVKGRLAASTTLFRYRLVGVEEAWVDAATTRQAAFHRLSPGNYTLEVMASGEDGRWPEQAQQFAFEVLPAYYQTQWFRATAILSALGLLWLAYRYHLTQIESRLTAQLDARLHERERIARGLHDTLLQGVQSLLLTFQAAVNRMPPGTSERTHLVEALDRAESVIKEGRDEVSTLRDVPSDTLCLPRVLEQHAHDLAAEARVACEVQVEGTPRLLKPLAYDDVLHIAREALNNAFWHSGAASISMVIRYGLGEMQIVVLDDGHGIPEAVLRGQQPADHWGLTGMRERAAMLRGQLQFDAPEQGGTRLQLVVGARHAYLERRSGGARRLLWPFKPSRHDRRSEPQI